MSTLISLRGGVGAGKTHAAKHLVKNHEFTKVSFADALKIEIYDALWSAMHNGFVKYAAHMLDSEYHGAAPYDLSYALNRYVHILPRPDTEFPCLDLYYIPTDEKLKWVNEHKGELRELLRFWGTEFRRASNENYWADQWKIQVAELLASGKDVVVDDARFENELELIRNMGGVHVFLQSSEVVRGQRLLKRDGTDAAVGSGHASETLSNNPTNWDSHIINSENEGEFFANIDRAVKDLPDAKV